MGTVLHVAEYPVVHPNPSNARVVANMRPVDWGTVALGGFTGYSWGWLTAAKQLRRGNARIVCTFGLLGGLFYGYQSTWNRFAGLSENEYEVKKFGALTDAQVKRYHDKVAIGNADLIDSSDPLDEPLPHPTKRYGKFTPEEVRNYRINAKTNPHLFDPLAPIVDDAEN